MSAGSRRAVAKPVPADVFVRAWISSTTMRQVMAKTGLSAQRVRNRAWELRRLGVNLPRFQGAIKPKPEAAPSWTCETILPKTPEKPETR